MLKSVVLDHFKGNRAAVGRAIGVTRSAVQQWPKIIPEAMAYRLERATDGQLKVDPSLYEQEHSASPQIARSA
jgi:transcriptional repressor of cell division inhibition gene dicB